MKINDILNEEYGVEAQKFVANDLSPFHVFVLKKAASGDLSLDNASEKASHAMYELEAGGLLDEYGNLTDYGNDILAQIEDKGGSYEKRNHALRRRPERGQLRRDDNESGMNEPTYQGNL